MKVILCEMLIGLTQQASEFVIASPQGVAISWKMLR